MNDIHTIVVLGGYTTGTRSQSQSQSEEVFVVTFEEKLLGLKVNARPSDSAPVVNEVRTVLILCVLTLYFVLTPSK